MKPSSSNEKLDGFQQRLRKSATKENPGIEAAKSSSLNSRGRSLSTARVSTRSRSSSKRRNNEEKFNTRGRSHSTYRKNQQALPAEGRPSATTRSRSKSQNRERSKSRASSKRWSSSATYRQSTQDTLRSQSCRSKSEVRTRKSAADMTDVTVRSGNRVEDTLRRSRSMSRSRTTTSNQGISTAAHSYLYSLPQCKSSTLPLGKGTAPSNNTAKEMLRRVEERTRSEGTDTAPTRSYSPSQKGNTKKAPASSRRFYVEVDEDMNILKLKEVNDETNVIEKPLLTSEQYRQSRRRSSSFDPPLSRMRQPTQDEFRKSRRRSSSCEPPLTRPNALRSLLKQSSFTSTFTSRSRSGLNQSVTFSFHNESTEDAIKRVSSYSRQGPRIVKDTIDFDPRLKESSSTQETSTINDDEEDSLGFFWGVPSESEDADYANLQSDFASNLAIVDSVGEVEEFDEDDRRSNHQLKPPMETNNSSKRGFFRKKSCRFTGPINTHSHGSEREEKEPSVLMTGAASCLEAQQQNKKWKRLYKMLNR